MIAADTSALSSYFKGEAGRAVDLVHSALLGNNICIPPVVLTELLSDPLAQAQMEETVVGFPLLSLLEGYWERAGHNRRLLLQMGLKAKTADTLVAQVCIDNDVLLITRDPDFRHFAKHCGLKLA